MIASLELAVDIEQLCYIKQLNVPDWFDRESRNQDDITGTAIFELGSLLLWDEWKSWSVSIQRFPRGDGSVKIYATAKRKTSLDTTLEYEIEDTNPADAVAKLILKVFR